MEEKKELIASVKLKDMYREHFFAHDEEQTKKQAKLENLNRYLAIRKLLSKLEKYNKNRDYDRVSSVPSKI